MNAQLKMMILASGKHQFKIAQEARISESAMSRVIRGRRRLAPEEAQRLAVVLGISVPDLYETFRGNSAPGGTCTPG